MAQKIRDGSRLRHAHIEQRHMEPDDSRKRPRRTKANKLSKSKIDRSIGQGCCTRPARSTCVCHLQRFQKHFCLLNPKSAEFRSRGFNQCGRRRGVLPGNRRAHMLLPVFESADLTRSTHEEQHARGSYERTSPCSIASPSCTRLARRCQQLGFYQQRWHADQPEEPGSSGPSANVCTARLAPDWLASAEAYSRNMAQRIRGNPTRRSGHFGPVRFGDHAARLHTRSSRLQKARCSQRCSLIVPFCSPARG